MKTEKSIKLSTEELRALDEGIQAAENGRRWTVKEALDFARKQRKAWKKKIQNSLSA